MDEVKTWAGMALGVVLVLGSGCAAPVPVFDPNAWRGDLDWTDLHEVPNPIVHRIHGRHGFGAYRKQADRGRVLHAQFDLDWRGHRVAGLLWASLDLGQCRIELATGEVVVFDGQTTWASRMDSEPGLGLGFQIKAWPFLLTLPFQLRSEGAHHDVALNVPLFGDRTGEATELVYESRLARESGRRIGKRHFVFADHDSGEVRAMGWVPATRQEAVPLDRSGLVRFASPVEVEVESWSEPVLFHRLWTFHDWNPVAGGSHRETGRGRLSRIDFVEAPLDAFERFPGAIRIDSRR